jgi:ubiquinone/menaquinone biosynthesis C-methylase UbiE
LKPSAVFVVKKKKDLMKKFLVLFLFIFSTLLSFGCEAQTKSKATDDNYTYKAPTRDGTGKIYMGREISQVMGFAGRSWLERQSREQEESVSLAIKNLPITAASAVADIGAGSGYYTFRIAPMVPQGKVFAVEIQDDAINYLSQKSKELGMNNVVTVKGTESTPNLPENAIDLAIMVDVYHELAYPKEMLEAIHKSLKPDGKFLLLEYRGEDPTIQIKPLHKMTEKQVEKELNANGFQLVENGKFMKIQHFLVFEKVK